MAVVRSSIRTVIVEDESLYREMLSTALQNFGDIDVLASFPDSLSALNEIPDLKPDVALLDISLGDGMSGIQLGLRLRRLLPELGIVLLSNHLDAQFMSAVPGKSISGWSYLLKKDVTDLASLHRAIQGAARGLVVLSPKLVHGHTPKSESPLGRLTPRQREVLSLIARGFSNAGIATELNLARKTVENYINEIYGSLGTDTGGDQIQPRVRAVLMFLGREEGLPDATPGATVP